MLKKCRRNLFKYLFYVLEFQSAKSSKNFDDKTIIIFYIAHLISILFKYLHC